MNSAVRNALDEASPAVDSKIIPVMREAVTTVQMILFQRLKASISRRYPDRREEDRVRLAGAVVNNLYGSETADPQVTCFARRHRELIEEELRGLGKQVPELIPHITDSLRMQTLCAIIRKVFTPSPACCLPGNWGYWTKSGNFPCPPPLYCPCVNSGQSPAWSNPCR